MAEALRKGNKVSCPACVFDAFGASLEERWSYQTFGGKGWRAARCTSVVAGAKGGERGLEHPVGLGWLREPHPPEASPHRGEGSDRAQGEGEGEG